MNTLTMFKTETQTQTSKEIIMNTNFKTIAITNDYYKQTDTTLTIDKIVKLFSDESKVMLSDTFTKQEYLEWKENWRYIYNELSLIIRKEKSLRKSSPYGYVSGLSYHRYIASLMMELRTNMREKAIALKGEVENG